MFTGLIEEVGTVAALEARERGARLLVNCAEVVSDLALGGSIAVNGVCLTAVDISVRGFVADLAPETLRVTNLGALTAGSLVNLERPLSPAGRLGGHIVQGHVDGTGELLSLDEVGEGHRWLRIRVPDDLERYLVYKGSVAVDGISLTVAAIDNGVLSITIIPHTMEQTALRQSRPGDRVNLECDLIAKYVQRAVAAMDLRRP